MGVMGGGVAFNLISFHVMHANDHIIPLDPLEKKVSNILKMDTHPDNMKINWKLIVGSAIFGMGWGFAGMCPGK